MNNLASAVAAIFIMGICAPAQARKPVQPASERPTSELEAELDKAPDKLHLIHGLRQQGKRGEKRAAKILEKAFDKAKDVDAKRTIANSLIELGNKDDKYWDFLAARARARVEDDMPMPMAYGTNGKAIKGKFADDYLAWCKKKGIEPESMTMDAFYASQNDILAISKTKDRRAIPILMKGLQSPNHMVVMRSAEGLASLQHEEAADGIIAACERLPAESAGTIARYLVFFKSPKAQAAAEKFIKKEQTLKTWRDKAKNGGADKLLEGQ